MAVLISFDDPDSRVGTLIIPKRQVNLYAFIPANLCIL